MNIDIIPILGAILLYVVVPFIKSKTTKEQRDNIYFYIKVAVKAAEQIFNKQGEGKKKKEYVLSYINSLGFKISEEDLDIMIESAVKEINIIGDEMERVG